MSVPPHSKVIPGAKGSSKNLEKDESEELKTKTLHKEKKCFKKIVLWLCLRWKQATQQVNAAVAGLSHYKKTSCNGLEITRICEMPEEALGTRTRTGPGMCNRELTFEMLILLPDLFGED
ncbi:hypothetical protein STEG23_034586 [Scotinomys teguina]